MFQLPDWPAWALRTFIGLATLTSSFAVVQKFTSGGKDDKESKDKKTDAKAITGENAGKFRGFQRQYLTVYYIIMLADWLQGTNMYTLYSSYGVNISALFITGFTSSLLFGTVIGLFVDRWGRRFSCIVYLLIEIVVNICEHYNNFPLLLLSRVAGGVSTSLLFSAFESWMVAEHRKLKFPEEWLADTFSWASFGNGLSAIAAGLLAQVCQDRLGEIGPFQAAIAFTILALPFVYMWEENYGESGGAQGTDGAELAEGEDKMTASLGAEGMKAIMSDKKVLLCGLVNSFFEGSMFSFVFMWVPTMLRVLNGSPLPNGLVFSSFMCCISLGGLIFATMNDTIGVEIGTVLVFLVGAAALMIPVLDLKTYTLEATLFSFVVFETCVGCFFPCAGTLRSKVVPDNVQGSVMNIFRIPLNIFVIVGTKLTDIYPAQTCFSIIVSWLLCGAGLQFWLAKELAKTAEASSEKKDKDKKGASNGKATSKENENADKNKQDGKETKKA